jgi:hypothetical protein
VILASDGKVKAQALPKGKDLSSSFRERYSYLMECDETLIELLIPVIPSTC